MGNLRDDFFKLKNLGKTKHRTQKMLLRGRAMIMR